MLSVKFPGFEVMGAPYRVGAPNGLYVKPNGFKGFDGMPSGRRSGVARPSAHGEYDLPVFRGARVLSIEGLAVASSEFDLANWRDLITGCGADGQQIEIHTDHLGEVVRMSARVIEATFNARGNQYGRILADFTMHMVCADPRKYGEPHEFSGASVQVHHYGNFPASPVVTVAGPVTGPYIVSGPGGRSITVAQSLSSGQTHRIDVASGYLYRNNVRQIGQITHWRPWTVPPNQRVGMSINKGSMTVKVTDTYM